MNVGVAGHITAAAPGGPRYDPNLTKEQRKSIKNAIWLCQIHGKHIDDDVLGHPTEMLQRWKEQAEHEANLAVGIGLPNAPLGRAELLDSLERQSQARCLQRWGALGLTPEESQSYLRDGAVGALPSSVRPNLNHSLRLILAEMGTGKSLGGERFFQESLAQFRVKLDGPIPVFLTARPVVGALETTIFEAASRLGEPTRQGVLFVVDDAMNVSGARVEETLHEARYLVGLWPQTQCLILSRPSAELNKEIESTYLPLLEESAAAAFVRDLSGHLSYNAAPSLKQAIRRPLFAILLAQATRQNLQSSRSLRSPGELLNWLVSRVLKRPGVNLSREDLQDQLGHLAIAILERGGPVPEAEFLSSTLRSKQSASLVQTGFVASNEGHLTFSLDILLEWFAAHGLQQGKVNIEHLIADPTTLWRWFYAICINLSQASHAEATTILVPLTKASPSIAIQVVEESLIHAGHLALREQTGTPPPWPESGQRIVEATRTWCQAIGSVARWLGPMNENGELRPLGIGVDGSVVTFSWYDRDEPKAEVELLPVEMRSFPHWPSQIDDGWNHLRSDNVGFSSAWAWPMSLSPLRSRLKDIVRFRRLPLNQGTLRGGALWREKVWFTALTAMNLGRYSYAALPLDEIEKRLEWIQAQGADAIASNQNQEPYLIAPLREVVEKLRGEGIQELMCPYPGPDEYSANGWWRDRETGEKTKPEEYFIVESDWWDNYSEEGLRVHVASIFEAALEGYGQLVDTWFPHLKPWLSKASLFPVRLVGSVEHPWRHGILGPSVGWHLESLDRSEGSYVEMRIQGDDEQSENWDDKLLAKLRAQRSLLRPEIAPWLPVQVTGRAFSFDGPPATELAFEWLLEDLKTMRLVEN